jgi:phospholipid/cholesterol/gamma-HCH transport system substrate-binding protein
MNNKVNFTLLGLFVTAVTILFFSILYWLAKPSHDEQNTFYGLFVTESINGINMGTNVKYQGLEVGKVKGFKINPDNPSEIMMALEIRKDIPIRDGVVARIKAQGITGLSYIDIQVEKNAEPLRKMEYLGETYSVIPFKSSLLNTLSDSADEITQTLQDILKKVDQTLHNNTDETQKTIHNLEVISRQLSSLLSDENIKNLSAILLHGNHLVQNTDLLVAQYQLVGHELNNTLKTVDQSIKNGDYNLSEIAGNLPYETALILRESRKTLSEFAQFLQKLKENPNALIFDATQPTPGPGE